MTLFEFLVQAIGFCAIVMNIVAMQFNSHGFIMLFKSLGSFLFCLQYLLLGAFSGLVMDFIGVIRNFIFAYNVKKGRSNKWWIVFFSIFTVVAGVITIVLTWSSTLATLSRWSTNATLLIVLAVFISIISILAKLLSTIGYGFKNPHTIRMINLPTFCMWIVYNFIVGSLAGILSDSMSIGSIVIAEARFKKKPEEQNEKDENQEVSAQN